MSAMAERMVDEEDMPKAAPLNIKLPIKGLKMRNCKQPVASVALVLSGLQSRDRTAI